MCYEICPDPVVTRFLTLLLLTASCREISREGELTCASMDYTSTVAMLIQKPYDKAMFISLYLSLLTGDASVSL